MDNHSNPTQFDPTIFTLLEHGFCFVNIPNDIQQIVCSTLKILLEVGKIKTLSKKTIIHSNNSKFVRAICISGKEDDHPLDHQFDKDQIEKVSNWGSKILRKIIESKFGIENSNHFLTLIHYKASLKHQNLMKRHRDYHLISGLFSTGPTEVYYDGNWNSITVPKGFMMIQIGGCAQLLTNNKYKGSPHGVGSLKENKGSLVIVSTLDENFPLLKRADSSVITNGHYNALRIGKRKGLLTNEQQKDYNIYIKHIDKIHL